MIGDRQLHSLLSERSTKTVDHFMWHKIVQNTQMFIESIPQTQHTLKESKYWAMEKHKNDVENLLESIEDYTDSIIDIKQLLTESYDKISKKDQELHRHCYDYSNLVSINIQLKIEGAELEKIRMNMLSEKKMLESEVFSQSSRKVEITKHQEQLYTIPSKKLVRPREKQTSFILVDQIVENFSFREQNLVLKDRVSTLKFSNGSYYAIGTGTGNLQLTNFVTGENTSMNLAHKSITSLSFSPQSNLIAAGIYDGSLRIHNTTDMKKEIAINTEKFTITDLHFISDDTIIIANKKPSIIMYDVVCGKEKANTGQNSTTSSILVTKYNNLFITGDMDGSIRLWDSRLSKPYSICKLYYTPITHIDEIYDCNKIVPINDCNCFHILDIRKPDVCLWRKEMMKRINNSYSQTFGVNRTSIFYDQNDGFLEEYNIDTQKRTQLKTNCNGRITYLDCHKYQPFYLISDKYGNIICGALN